MCGRMVRDALPGPHHERPTVLPCSFKIKANLCKFKCVCPGRWAIDLEWHPFDYLSLVFILKRS